MDSLQGALRIPISLFRIGHFYTKPRPPTTHSEISPLQREWVLWLARQEKDLPDWVILDRDSIVNPTKLDFCLEPIKDVDEIDSILASLPEELRLKIFRIAEAWGVHPKKKEPLTATDLIENGIIVRPVPQLKDPSRLGEVDWPEFVNSLIGYETKQKDPVLREAHRAHLLRGIYPGINPNAIQATNSGTGKTSFYSAAGENYGKVTAKAFLGFAKSPVETYPGVIDNMDLPVGIDQIESQSAGQIMRFMFNALESGEDFVISGAAKFRVRTRSCFSLLANPIGYGADTTKSFASLIDHLSFNPALGRRFGLIIFGKDFQRITRKPTPEELAEWRQRISVFRAVEEYAQPKLRALIHSTEVWTWINSVIPQYEKQVQTLAEQLKDETVRTLLEEHAAGAQPRIRGAAVYAVAAVRLADIALNRLETSDFLEECDQQLQQYAEMNLASITRICKEWAKEQSAQTRLWFETLPDYAKEIVSAAELYRRTSPSDLEIPLSMLPYEPSKESYRTLNECLRKLAGRKKSAELLERIKHYTNSAIVCVNDVWKLTLLQKEPVEEIAPTGRLVEKIDGFDGFDDSTTLSDTRPDRPALKGGSLGSPSNGRNGRNPQEPSREIMRRIVETLEVEKEKPLTAPTVAYHIGLLDKGGSVETVEILLEEMQKEGLVEKDSDGHWTLRK